MLQSYSLKNDRATSLSNLIICIRAQRLKPTFNVNELQGQVTPREGEKSGSNGLLLPEMNWCEQTRRIHTFSSYCVTMETRSDLKHISQIKQKTLGHRHIISDERKLDSNKKLRLYWNAHSGSRESSNLLHASALNVLQLVGKGKHATTIWKRSSCIHARPIVEHPIFHTSLPCPFHLP